MKIEVKTVADYLSQTPADRAALLKTAAVCAKDIKTVLAKVLHAAGKAGDYKPGEMNTYAVDTTGIEIRREIQGVYERVRVLEAIDKGDTTLTEIEFDHAGDYGLVKLPTFIENHKESVPQVEAIIRSNVQVRKRIDELLKSLKSPAKGEGENSGDGEGDASGIQTPQAADPIGDFLASLGDTPLLSDQRLLDRLIADVHGSATPQCAARYADIFGTLKAHAESRGEYLEAEAGSSEITEVPVLANAA